MELKLEEVTHVLKAYKFYLMQITHCAFDEATAQWIIDNRYPYADYLCNPYQPLDIATDPISGEEAK